MSKTFSKITETNNTLLVVDSLNLAFRYKHSGATDFAEDYLRTVQSLKKSYKASHVIIAGDMGSSSYRKAIYPEYKQNRKDKFAEQTDAEKAAFELFFEDFTKTLEHIAENTEFPILRFQGVDADDIAGFSSAMINLLTDSDLYNRTANLAFERSKSLSNEHSAALSYLNLLFPSKFASSK